MLQTLEGSQAIAATVARCRPQVVAAYPITPQTHIVESISRLVAEGSLQCELVSVESEFSAASVVLGAAAAGSRAYTATASQGILLMSEVLYNIAGLRVPLVLTCANRAVGAPLSIWNDQQDAMAVRDAGWIQLFCADNQEAVDTTIQAFRIAEECELPVMVCVDGFTLTHTLESIDVPEQQQVDDFLPAYSFNRRLHRDNPLSLGTLVSPDWFPEARHSHQVALEQSREVIRRVDQDWAQVSGRSWGGLFSVSGDEQAPTAIISIGSITGTLEEAAEIYTDAGAARIVRLRSLRPFPGAELAEAIGDARDVIVVERALSPGGGGIIGNEVRAAFQVAGRQTRIHNVAVGLGGRDVPLDIYPRLLAMKDQPQVTQFQILDVQLDKLPPEDR